MAAVANLALASVATAVVRAELTQIPGDFGWRQGIPLHLVAYQAVREDLGLDADSVPAIEMLRLAMEAEIKSEQSRLLKSVGNLENLSAIERSVFESKRRAVAEEVRMKRQPELDALLTGDQQTRLYQIYLQTKELDALRDSALADELGLSEQQRAQILDLYKACQRAEAKTIKGGAAARARYDEAKKARREGLPNVLTPEQRETFDKLRGKPMKGLHRSMYWPKD